MSEQEKIVEMVFGLIAKHEPRKCRIGEIFGIKPSIMKGMEPLIESYEGFSSIGEGIFSDVSYKDLDKPVDVCVANIGYLEKGSGNFEHHFSRISQTTHFEMRNKITTHAFNLMFLERCIAFHNGHQETIADVFGYDKKNKRLVCITKTDYGEWHIISELTHEERAKKAQEHILAAMGIEFNRRYVWRAEIGLPDAPSVSFTTDPTGARELFKLRDVADGKRRRDALKNWVREHWRNKRDSEEDKTYVRKHLRGATAFNWCGYQVKIKPSRYDLDENVKLEIQRLRNENELLRQKQIPKCRWL